MEQDIYLYPGSQSEAHRLGEAALWDASFHANVSCARDIEAVIRVYGDGRSALKPEASQMVLKRWGFKRTNFVLANTIERLGPYKEQLSAENQEWQKKAYVPPDDAHNRYFEVDTALAYLDAFISQVRHTASWNYLGRSTANPTPMNLWTMRAGCWCSVQTPSRSPAGRPRTSSGWPMTALDAAPTLSVGLSAVPAWAMESRPDGTAQTSPAF